MITGVGYQSRRIGAVDRFKNCSSVCLAHESNEIMVTETSEKRLMNKQGKETPMKSSNTYINLDRYLQITHTEERDFSEDRAIDDSHQDTSASTHRENDDTKSASPHFVH